MGSNGHDDATQSELAFQVVLALSQRLANVEQVLAEIHELDEAREKKWTKPKQN